MGIVCPQLRASAQGQPCTFRIPGVCNCDRETTVLCHAPSNVKGMGSKGHDFNAAFGCYACHEALDQHRLPSDQALGFWLRGCQETMEIWVKADLVTVRGVDPAAAKHRPGKKAHIPQRPRPGREPTKPAVPHPGLFRPATEQSR